jgi:hypothetical protein
MSTKRWEFLHFLSDEEKAALDDHDRHIKWLKERLLVHEGQRYEIVNRGTQRARLEAKRRTKDLERREDHATRTP